MTPRPTGSRGAPTALRSAGGGSRPTLPAWKAFAVQFSLETCTRVGVFSGRIEHLNSGRRARFASREDLLAVMERMLAEIEKSST